MLSVRAFARSAPRSMSRLAGTSICKSVRQAPLQSLWKPMHSQAVAAFSTSRLRMQKEKSLDGELIAKIESEMQLESDMKENDEVPISVKDFLENSGFQITDKPGQEEVTLTKKFGDESITVSFSIADLHNMDQDPDQFMDPAQRDEEDLGQESQAPLEGNEDQGEDGLGDGEGEDTPLAVRVNVNISKPTGGVVVFETVASSGTIAIENIYHYANLALAEAKTAEKAHERQNFYPGPPFSNLDEDLQGLFERYLNERGINASMALFVPDYIEMKEQKEYVKWLSKLQKFVEA